MTWPQVGGSCLGHVSFWVVFSLVFYSQIIVSGLTLILTHNLLQGGLGEVKSNFLSYNLYQLTPP